MFPQPRSPILTPAPASLILPPKQPFSLHPSCVLALLSQHDDKWFDYSGNGNHGIIYGPTPTAKGRHGFAYSFDGVDDYGDCGNHASLDITDAITIVARIKPLATITTFQRIVAKEIQGDAYAWGVRNRNNLDFHTLPISFWTTNSPLQVGIWQHAVVAYDKDAGANNLNLYLNRNLVATDTFTDTLPSNINRNLAIGARPDNTVNFNGPIAGVWIYNQAWSPNPADPNYLPEIDPGPPPYD